MPAVVPAVAVLPVVLGLLMEPVMQVPLQVLDVMAAVAEQVVREGKQIATVVSLQAMEAMGLAVLLVELLEERVEVVVILEVMVLQVQME